MAAIVLRAMPDYCSSLAADGVQQSQWAWLARAQGALSTLIMAGTSGRQGAAVHLHHCLGNTPTSCPGWDGMLGLGSSSTVQRLLGSQLLTKCPPPLLPPGAAAAARALMMCRAPSCCRTWSWCLRRVQHKRLPVPRVGYVPLCVVVAVPSHSRSCNCSNSGREQLHLQQRP